jgi:hypothetical protein
MVRSLSSGLLFVVLAAALGCQRQPTFHFAPVEGTVTKGGKPLAGVLVVFYGDLNAGTTGPHSSGRTDATGHYRLRTDQGDDGALVGQHLVCIVDSAILLSRRRGSNSDRNHLPKELTATTSAKVPPSYTRRDETPLRAEVRPGEQVIDFEVK